MVPPAVFDYSTGDDIVELRWDSSQSYPVDMGAQLFALRAGHVTDTLSRLNPQWGETARRRLDDVDRGPTHYMDRGDLHVFELWVLEHDGRRPYGREDTWVSADGWTNMIDNTPDPDIPDNLEGKLIRVWSVDETGLPFRFRLYA